jgi:predicted nucleotidyltransferase
VVSGEASCKLEISYLWKTFSDMNKGLIISRIKKTIHDKDHKADVFLFGSRARGDNRSDSDWDILILIDSSKVTNEIEDQFRDGLYDIELDSGQIISTFIYPKDLWESSLRYSPLYKNVKKEGIQL